MTKTNEIVNKKTDKFFNLKSLIGVISVIISIIALIVSINTLSCIQKSFEAEYKKQLHIGIEKEKSNETQYIFTITNDSLRQQMNIKEISIVDDSNSRFILYPSDSDITPIKLINGDVYSIALSERELKEKCSYLSGGNFSILVKETNEKEWYYKDVFDL